MKTDKDLQHDVQVELNWEPSVNAAHIGVSAKDGVVCLLGHVPSYAEKLAAEKATKRVYGAKAVVDELEVKLPRNGRRTDEDVASCCVAALKHNYAVPAESIKVLLNNGWVTLDGDVEWQYQKAAAESAVCYLTGVVGVTNNINLKPRVSTSDVRHKIEDAFKRNAEIDARRVKVDASNGKVTLKGCVRSWAERDEAQHAAWSAPGVTLVENLISVSP